MRKSHIAFAALAGLWLALASPTASAWVTPQGGTAAAAKGVPPAVDTAPSAASVPAPAPWSSEPAAGTRATGEATTLVPADPTALTPAASGAPAGLLVAAPSAVPAPRVPLYKKWWFWTIAGGLFAGSVITTYVVTRPPPLPYYGSVGTMMF